MKGLLLLALFACKRDHDDSIDQAVRRLVTDDGPGTQVAVDYRGWDEKAPLVHVGHDTFESESRSLNVHFTFDGGRVRVIHLMFGSAALTMTNPTPL